MKYPSCVIFLNSRRSEDIKYVWDIIWGMSGASTGACLVHHLDMSGASSGACLGHHLGYAWGMSVASSGAFCQQWTTIRCATCICDAVLLSCLVDAGHALQDVLSGEHRPCHRGQRDHLQRHSSARIPARPSKRPGYRGHAGHFPLIFIFSVKHFGGFALLCKLSATKVSPI